jgi:hypothetical protein
VVEQKERWYERVDGWLAAGFGLLWLTAAMVTGVVLLVVLAWSCVQFSVDAGWWLIRLLQ